MADITFALTIGGTALPVTQFNMTGGAFGTVGHLTVKTTQTMLDQCKLDLFGMTSGAPAFVEVILTVTEQYGASPAAASLGATPRSKARRRASLAGNTPGPYIPWMMTWSKYTPATTPGCWSIRSAS
jgi:hypothetical protein